MRRFVLVLLAFLSAAGGGPGIRAAESYREPYRPQYHFSPRQHWTNDPNGLVYFDGEYHLFFQYNPFGDVWGHMSWGHAVSRDLLHWRELPVAIKEEDGIMIFTGSVVVDERNTSGFCAGGEPCMVAIYTGHHPASRPGLQTQNLAYSNDRGRTWTKFRGNPVLDLHLSSFRDPHVFWSEQARRWVMTVALPRDHKVLFYGSDDLKSWRPVGEFGPAGAVGGQWECPTLVEVPVDGDARNTRWVLKVGLNPGGLQGGSGEQYFVGRFDGARFVNDNPDTTTLWTDYGKDCYCALAFNGLARTERPAMIGWMNNWQYADKVPTDPWRGQMTVPRRLALRRTAEGIRLAQAPVEKLAGLRENHFFWRGHRAGELNHRLKSHTRLGRSFELRTTVTPAMAEEVGWKLLAADGTYTVVGYSKSRGELFVDRSRSGDTGFSSDFPGRTTAPLIAEGASLQFTILVDRMSVEVFAQDGKVAMTNLVFPPSGPLALEFYYRNGRPKQVSMDLWSLKSTWTARR